MADHSRRTARSRTAILRAAWDLCVEQPYAKVTIEGIASRAGVGKPTIYRWWPSKGAVILDAMMEEVSPAIGFTETGDDLEDLRAWLRSVAVMLADPATGLVISGLVGAAQHDADLARMWHERVYLPTRTVTVERIRRAQGGGRLPDTDPQILADLLAAPIWFRFLLAGGDPSPEHADAVFNAVLR